MRRRLTNDDLRADPDYQELGRLLDKQTAAQKARFEKSLEEAEVEVMKSPKKPTTIPPEWLEPLRNLIREEIQAMNPNVAINADTALSLPPKTPRLPKSKKYAVDRVTLPGCRVDQVLFRRFEQLRIESGNSASEAMQRILWNYFGRPKLSFEADD